MSITRGHALAAVLQPKRVVATGRRPRLAVSQRGQHSVRRQLRHDSRASLVIVPAALVQPRRRRRVGRWRRTRLRSDRRGREEQRRSHVQPLMKRAWPPGVAPAQRAAARAARRDCRRRRARGAAGDEQLRQQHARKAWRAGVSPLRRARQVRRAGGREAAHQQRSAQQRHAVQRREAPQRDAAPRVSTMRMPRARAAPRRRVPREVVAWRGGGVCCASVHVGRSHGRRPRPQRLRRVTARRRRHAGAQGRPRRGAAPERSCAAAVATRAAALRLGGSSCEAGEGLWRARVAGAALFSAPRTRPAAAARTLVTRAAATGCACTRLRPRRGFPALDGRGRAALFGPSPPPHPDIGEVASAGFAIAAGGKC